MTDDGYRPGLAERRRAFVDGLFFRVVACIFLEVVVLATAVSSGLPISRFVGPMAAAAVAGVLNVPYWYAGKRRGFPLGDFYAHWALDLFAITLSLYWIGGMDVPYGPFVYSMIVITSATFMSRRGSYVVAAGSALSLVVLSVGTRLGVFPAPMPVWSHHYSPSGEVALVIGAVVFFFLNAYLAGTLADQLKVAKTQIEQQNRSLEERVRERTQLLEARTRELQDRAEEMHELVNIVTHDLQNIAVAGAETTRKLVEIDGAKLSSRGQRYAARLQGDCREMARMLRSLLDVVNQTEVSDRRTLVDVATIVRDVVARAQSVMESKGIEIAVGELPPLYAERQKMQHVFENLVSNACKYVGDKPEARIEVGGVLRNGNVEYYVSDNGIGIEAGQLGRIFHLYHRAPDQTVGGVVQQGHGIGLAVVKRIVQRYGGRIWVESVPGEGTTFHLAFPREGGAEG